MAAVLISPPYQQFFDTDGITPLAGGFVYTYAAGTTTPKASYTDASGSIAAANPVVLDSLGRAVLWGIGSYRIDVRNASNVSIKITDNISTFITATTQPPSYFQSFSGDGSTVNFALSQNVGTDSKAILVFMGNSSSTINTPQYEALNNTANQTVFTTANNYGTDPNAIMVFQATAANVFGRVLRPGTDYTINGTTLTLTTGNATAYTPGLLIFREANFTGTAGLQIQNPATYTISGTTLTFTTAPVSGTNNIYVFAPLTLLGTASAYSDAAQSFANAANVSATNAAASATSAANSATLSTTNANTSLTNANAAGNSAATATTQAGIATTQAGIATTQATNAGNSATAASTSATQAATSANIAGMSLVTTSTTTNTIGTGNKTFTVDTNKSFTNQNIRASNGANTMDGTVASYNPSTGQLVIAVATVSGSGTFSSWSIGVTGAAGASGSGAGTVTSVSVATANGFSGTVSNATSTPSITLNNPTDITLSTVNQIQFIANPNGFTIKGGTSTNRTVNFTNSGSISGTNTGDQTITLTGDVTGSGNGSFAATLTNTAVTAGTYNNATVTVDAKGRITSATSGVAPTSPIKAWVSFQINSGVVTVNDSLNIASVTRTGGGQYTVNFNVPFSNAYYGLSGSIRTPIAFSNGIVGFDGRTARTTTTAYVTTTVSNTGNQAQDFAEVFISFFGN